MPDSTFSSSDSVRTARPLRYARKAALRDPLALEQGGRLESVTVAYETYGRLNSRRDNAVLVCHALSGDSHVARHNASDDPGWRRLSSARRSPLTRASTSSSARIRSAAAAAPRVRTASTLRRASLTAPTSRSSRPPTSWRSSAGWWTGWASGTARGRRRLHLGGHQVLQWATQFPDRMEAAVALATSARLSAQALAFDVARRNAILRDPDFHGGQYYGKRGPAVGLALARMYSATSPISPPRRCRTDSRPTASGPGTSRPSSRSASPSAPTSPTRATGSSSASTPTATSSSPSPWTSSTSAPPR